MSMHTTEKSSGTRGRGKRRGGGVYVDMCSPVIWRDEPSVLGKSNFRENKNKRRRREIGGGRGEERIFDQEKKRKGKSPETPRWNSDEK